MKIYRTTWVHLSLMLLLLLHSFSLYAVTSNKQIRIGLTPVFLDEQLQLLRDLESYLEQHLGENVKFVQRQTYRDISGLLLSGELDAAWLCGYPYLNHKDNLSLLSVPLYQGRPYYQSYLITSSDNPKLQTLEDLRDRTFAFSDPDSNSGYLFPVTKIKSAGWDAGKFFRRTFFTWGHRGVIEAVAEGVADAGAVDGYVWETLRLTRPDLVSKTRIIVKSEEFGFPPFVYPRGKDERAQKIARVLQQMHQDSDGQTILKRLNLDGFIEATPKLYRGIASMIREYKSVQKSEN